MACAVVHPAPGRCILRSMEQTFVDRLCTPPLRTMEEIFEDLLCIPPQAAAFSGPWRKHLWTAGAPCPRPLHSQVPLRKHLWTTGAPRPRLLHSQVHGGNICGPLVHPAPGCCILRSMEQTFADRLCTTPQAAAF
jgi:hypothetical protein